MREIKFRAWDKTIKKMFKNADIDVRMDLDGNLYQADSEYSITDSDLLWNDLSRENVELMQYTGLKDKNGKEIYEGDIVTCGTLEGNPVGAITWLENSAEYLVINKGLQVEYVTKLHAEYMQVIGNIYENKELLP